jgi:GDPmannose 4,6-dehydratase
LPRALIVGCNGQDGTLLSEFLERRAYTVNGIARHAAAARSPALVHYTDIENPAAVRALLQELGPDEVYFLAAHHHSAEGGSIDAHELISRSFAINTFALNNFLSCICDSAPPARLFYAASSRVFGNADNVPQDENTPMKPICPYGISKTAGAHLCRYYRQERGVFASVGILYNHESPLRTAAFLSRKIARAVVEIKRGLRDRLVVGSLNAMVDWGFAPDYVEAMWRILQAQLPDDFIIATGILHSVRDFVQTAFRIAGLPWEPYVVEDASALNSNRPSTLLQGNRAKLGRITGWHPRISFEEMIAAMILAEESLAEERLAEERG